MNRVSDGTLIVTCWGVIRCAGAEGQPLRHVVLLRRQGAPALVPRVRNELRHVGCDILDLSRSVIACRRETLHWTHLVAVDRRDAVIVRQSRWPMPIVCKSDASHDWFRSMQQVRAAALQRPSCFNTQLIDCQDCSASHRLSCH